VSSSGLSVVAELAGTSVIVRFTGNADMTAIEPLDDYLVALHAQVRTRSLSSVTVDFRELEFMNSSCFKCFVTWLGIVQDLQPEQQYKIVFASNRELHWQRRSLNALRCFAMSVVSIEA
jgi:hypothetical protein